MTKTSGDARVDMTCLFGNGSCRLSVVTSEQHHVETHLLERVDGQVRLGLYRIGNRQHRDDLVCTHASTDYKRVKPTAGSAGVSTRFKCDNPLH